jgi:hypothetical protein
MKVSSLDSQEMITKYFQGAWQMQKKNPKYDAGAFPKT